MAIVAQGFWCAQLSVPLSSRVAFEIQLEAQDILLAKGGTGGGLKKLTMASQGTTWPEGPFLTYR